jgi:hypothetical protein
MNQMAIFIGQILLKVNAPNAVNYFDNLFGRHKNGGVIGR